MWPGWGSLRGSENFLGVLSRNKQNSRNNKISNDSCSNTNYDHGNGKNNNTRNTDNSNKTSGNNIDGNSESSDKSNHTTNQNQSQNGNADMLFNTKQHLLMSCYM